MKASFILEQINVNIDFVLKVWYLCIKSKLKRIIFCEACFFTTYNLTVTFWILTLLLLKFSAICKLNSSERKNPYKHTKKSHKYRQRGKMYLPNLTIYLKFCKLCYGFREASTWLKTCWLSVYISLGQIRIWLVLLKYIGMYFQNLW